MIKTKKPVEENNDFLLPPDPERVIASAMHDKKADGESIVTVRLDDIGSFRFEAASQEQLMEDYLEVFG